MAAIGHVARAIPPVIITPPPSSRGSAPARPVHAHDEASAIEQARAAQTHKAKRHHDPQSKESGGEGAKSHDPRGLTEEEQKQLTELRARDREVRNHEQAHKNAGGPYASAPSYEYTRGPDGGQYAVSGEVSIDASPIAGNPSATISKMEIVIRAALAPAEPSGQDMKVASQARAAKTQAQGELRQEKAEEQSTGFAALRQRLGLEDSVDGLTPANKAAQAYQTLENLLEQQTGTFVSVAA